MSNASTRVHNSAGDGACDANGAVFDVRRSGASCDANGASCDANGADASTRDTTYEPIGCVICHRIYVLHLVGHNSCIECEAAFESIGI